MKVNLHFAVTVFVGHFILCSARQTELEPGPHPKSDNFNGLPHVLRFLTGRISGLSNIRPDFVFTRRSPKGFRAVATAGSNGDSKQVTPFVLWQRRYVRSPSRNSNNNSPAKNNKTNSMTPWYKVKLHYEETGNSDYRSWKFHPVELIQPIVQASQGQKKVTSGNGMDNKMTRHSYLNNPSKHGNYMYSNGIYHRMDHSKHI